MAAITIFFVIFTLFGFIQFFLLFRLFLFVGHPRWRRLIGASPQGELEDFEAGLANTQPILFNRIQSCKICNKNKLSFLSLLILLIIIVYTVVTIAKFRGEFCICLVSADDSNWFSCLDV